MIKKITVSGPVIIENKKLLVIKDDEDDFYKIPGGTRKGRESLEDTCRREFNEETGLRCRILYRLANMKLDKNPQTGEEADIKLYHYQCELIHDSLDFSYKSFRHREHEVRWIRLTDLVRGKYPIAPNIKYLIKIGEIARGVK
ncbi:MAG TPA: NUDIX domain-containing protein [Patescibacteria group bacterium]|nr:NUDIX domain-containing protein [Patescibacteria group bacterium]